MPSMAAVRRLAIPRVFPAQLRSNATVTSRSFSTTRIILAGPLSPRRIVLDSEIQENFLKGSGPGGQKINKTSSAVQLKHLPTGIVVKCQETRSRSQNRKTARKLLGERIEELELGESSRNAIKAREKSKKKSSADKKKRRKYKLLAESKTREQEDRIIEVEGKEGDDIQASHADNADAAESRGKAK